MFDAPFLTEVSITPRNQLTVTRYVSPKNTRLQTSGTQRFFEELDAYFKGGLRRFTQRLKYTHGTDFEREVWNAIRKVPYGEVRTYKWVAERIGRPNAVRAVGRVLGKNPLPIIIPCHRIIASDGTLGGFSCGLAVKEWLLKHESDF
jgi:methylated-DNA-[protein]-cysteine S-methyltransferase